jgi:N-acetyl-alpha-D-glucosaminyl L-malate synthase BshA
VHVSNFRPVKRIDAVIRVFARMARQLPARLLLVGDGPELGTAYRLGRELGVAELVEAVGAQEAIVPLLSAADLFLLPSAQESFGLAALEAMACGVPVVASRVAGLPEVIEHGVTGFLHPPEDEEGMAVSGINVLSDPVLHRRMAAAARRTVTERFCSERVVPLYEEYYRGIIDRGQRPEARGQ